MRVIGALLALALSVSCGSSRPDDGASSSRSTERRALTPSAVVLITIDTLRADRVGAYGWQRARTPAIDRLAARGVRFDHAYAAAPITLPSHASLLTGLYPPQHGARHNGMRVNAGVPTIAELLQARGFATGAFIAAFPLDRRFGLDRGFSVYSDAMPRGPDGRLRNERSGREVVDEALAWVDGLPHDGRFFLWVHLFEPHAPYQGEEAEGTTALRSISERYDDEIARADVQVARLVQKLASRLDSTLFVVAADHGEAFGEHEEVGHSVFVYDTTLRVPLVLAGAGVGHAGSTATEAVSLVDVAPTLLDLLGLSAPDMNGTSLRPLMSGGTLGGRELYAESFAPLLDFGWSPLRTLRRDGRKYIAAPAPELYDTARDPAEARNEIASQAATAKQLADRIDRIAPADLAGSRADVSDREAVARLRSLGYLASSAGRSGERPDPKNRVAVARRIGEVTSGELQGPALRAALERIVSDEPRNGQMQMRLGYVLLEAGECPAALPHFEAAVAASVPSADPQLGLAECLGRMGRRADARKVLVSADETEPGNPVVAANLGLIALAEDHVSEAIDRLGTALAGAPDLHEARFALARAYGRGGRRRDAAREARELLARLPADAPQRAEVTRLLRAVE